MIYLDTSPSPPPELKGSTSASSTSRPRTCSRIDLSLGDALRAVGDVASDMVAAGTGTILVTTVGGSIAPDAALANINIAAAGLRNWTLDLHSAIEPRGVHVAHVAITALIDGGHPDAAASVIAKSSHDLHRSRDRVELHCVAWDA